MNKTNTYPSPRVSADGTHRSDYPSREVYDLDVFRALHLDYFRYLLPPHLPKTRNSRRSKGLALLKTEERLGDSLRCIEPALLWVMKRRCVFVCIACSPLRRKHRNFLNARCGVYWEKWGTAFGLPSWDELEVLSPATPECRTSRRLETGEILVLFLGMFAFPKESTEIKLGELRKRETMYRDRGGWMYVVPYSTSVSHSI